MKIIALEKEIESIERGEFQIHSRDEAMKVWELYKSGLIREIYFRKDKNLAVLVLECKDEYEAREILNTLPMAKNNLIDFEIVPLKAYPGFERLFAK
jgi:muconolactone delta-isomerase